jgi:transposase-like protein
VTRYSPELKQQIVKKMLPPNSQSVAALSRESGISTPTLYAWRKQLRTQGHVVPTTPSAPDRWDAKTKLATVIRTATMNEAERSAYCREHGLYVEQLDVWRQAFESVDTVEPASKADLAAMRKTNRKLKKELHRKEKALAEAAALLTLSKKAEAIWGTDEDA